MSDERDKDWTLERMARDECARRFPRIEELAFWGESRRELARLIYDVERNRNRPE